MQHETVCKIVDRIVADSECVAGRPLITIEGNRTFVEPKGADGILRLRRAWLEAQKLGLASAVLAELRRRGFEAGASQVAAE